MAKKAFLVFAALYLLAILLLLIGLFGWFGQEQDPLSAVFLLSLGLPWNLFADWAGVAGVATLVLAPAINAGILWCLSKRRAHKS